MRQNSTWTWFRTAVLAASLAGLAFPSPGLAQGLQEQQGEVTALAGGLFTGDGSSLAVGGGGYGAVSDRWAVGGEVTYAPGAGLDFNMGGVSSSVSSSAIEAHGGVQYLLSATEKAQPYLAGGIGILRSSTETSSSVSYLDSINSGSVSGTAFLLHVGGGMRYWLGERWGVKPELKVFFGDTTAVRASVGLFYQFGE